MKPAMVTLVALNPAMADVAALLHADSGLTETWDASAFAVLLGTPGAAGRLAVETDEPVGLVLWRVAADEAEILTICVAPGRRRRGVGRDLLNAALNSVAAAGVRTLFLEVADINAPAIALYRSLGFGERGRRPGYYASPDGPVDALVLAKEFDR